VQFDGRFFVHHEQFGQVLEYARIYTFRKEEILSGNSPKRVSVRCTSFGPGRSTSVPRITCTGRVVNAHTGGACQRGVTETLFIALRAHNKKIPFLGIRIQLRDEQAQGCCGLG
jgi:hypothetical protein